MAHATVTRELRPYTLVRNARGYLFLTNHHAGRMAHVTVLANCAGF